jgi:chorismate mutase
MDKLWAVRGAITIPQDCPEEVLSATEELLREIFRVNRIDNENIVSILFTVTPDIRSEFPAVGARRLGLTETPLTCAQEIPKCGALPLCIRVLIHFYTSLPKKEIKPVYLREAVRLRPDLAE